MTNPRMTDGKEQEQLEEAVSVFEREIGVTGLAYEISQAGARDFLKFVVGREAPVYDRALLQCQKKIASDNIFKGAMGLKLVSSSSFPASVEANALLTLLTRSTREVSEGMSTKGNLVPYVPFRQREDHQLAQPASHIVRGRRGVGKSTLIRRATELISASSAAVVVLDMQTYSTLTGDDLIQEVFYDICLRFADKGDEVCKLQSLASCTTKLRDTASEIMDGTLKVERAPVATKRAITALTKGINGNAYLFLDDFHLVDYESQPRLLHFIHAALKGANGWLKVAGLSSLLNIYAPETGLGLQIPGDAQVISLDLTLENPAAAQEHLALILDGFLKAVGYVGISAALQAVAFKRLAWANAGVPRDFLQMFARSIGHAQKNKRATVTLSDINVAIGEFGQQKMDELVEDARNEAGSLKKMLDQLESLCIDENKVNAFLIRQDGSKEQQFVKILSDLRLVHLINQSITPDTAGERYEAFILDYSLFTGFRRRPNVREMIPEQDQFKASELRILPKVAAGFFKPDN